MDWVHFGSNFICQPYGGQTVRIIFLLNFLFFEASKAACLLSNFQKSLCFKTCIYTLLSINLFILFGTSKPPKDLEQKDIEMEDLQRALAENNLSDYDDIPPSKSLWPGKC